MAAGEYNRRLKWLKASKSSPTSTGDEVVTHSANGYLWCNVEEQPGVQGAEADARETGADAIIRVGQWPALSALDALQDVELGNVWRIDSIYKTAPTQGYELVLQCHRWDTFVDINIV